MFVDQCKSNGEVATGAAIICLATGMFTYSFASILKYFDKY
jgi:hypothetical protein